MRAFISRPVLAASTATILIVGLGGGVGADAVTTGGTTPLPPPTGCLERADLSAACGPLRGAHAPLRIAVAPNGRHAYVGDRDAQSVVVLDRNLTTGRLTQKAGPAGCVGVPADCTPLPGLGTTTDVTVSPDGRHLYVASYSTGTLRSFAINSTNGTLAAIACYGPGGGCTPVRGMSNPWDAAVSPDGESVYVASPNSDSLAVFARNTATGSLAQLPGIEGCHNPTGSDGCTNDERMAGPLAVATPTNAAVVAVAADADAILSFQRASNGAIVRGPAPNCLAVSHPNCAPVPGLAGADTLAAAGGRAYVATTDRIVSIARSDTGTLAYLSCAGPAAGCTPVRGFQASHSLATSPTGSHVYAGPRWYNNGVPRLLAFRRTGGGLAQIEGAGGCRASGVAPPGCSSTPGLGVSGALTVSRDGRSVHVASSDASNGTVTTFRIDRSAPSCSARSATVRRNTRPGCSCAAETRTATRSGSRSSASRTGASSVG